MRRMNEEELRGLKLALIRALEEIDAALLRLQKARGGGQGSGVGGQGSGVGGRRSEFGARSSALGARRPVVGGT
jgi:hypothetical protein